MVNWKLRLHHKNLINASTVCNTKYSNLFIFKIVHRVIRIHNKITLLPVLHQCSSFGEVSHLQRPLKAIPLKNKKIIHSLKPTLHVWSSSSGWNARATNCTCSRYLNSHAYKVTHSETNYHKHSFFLTYNKGMKICCLMTLSSCWAWIHFEMLYLHDRLIDFMYIYFLSIVS